MTTIEIFYAPQPDERSDESSAAFEYAKRTSDILLKKDETNSVNIHRFSLTSLDSTLYPTRKEMNPSASSSCRQFIILISCSADGSVDRTIRKVHRKLKNVNGELGESSTPKQQKQTLAIALLGHARCENSANQMNDTIFHFGRKFYMTVKTSCTSNVSISEPFESQVELEGPDIPAGFDEWVHGLGIVSKT